MGLRRYVISLSTVFAVHAFATKVDGVVMNKRITCANFLDGVIRQNRFVANSTVIPILPYDSLFQSAKGKFHDVLTFIDLATDARNGNPRRVSLVVHVSGLTRDMGDGGRFLGEIAAYGVTPELNMKPKEPRHQSGEDQPERQPVPPDYFLRLDGPSNLVLDVIGHPAVTVVTRLIGPR